jgi:DNA-binding transcriptional MerR regulator
MAAERVNTAVLMTIGRFSKASRLSLKALRLYDALGLLPPASIDEDTGYRYYHESQLTTARLIAMLRQLDMPLSSVASVLEQSGADAARVLQAYWREVEDETATRRRLVAYIDRYLRKGEAIMHQVETRQVGEQKLLTIERRTLADQLPNVIGRDGDTLIRQALANGIEITGPMTVIYHGLVTMDADGPIEICVPVAGNVEPFADARVRVEPAHNEAYARITKSQVAFPDILTAYDSVEAWLKENGKKPNGSPREVYLAEWDNLSDEDPACDIAWPYEA